MGLSWWTASPWVQAVVFGISNRIPVKGRDGQVGKMRAKQTPTRPQKLVPPSPRTRSGCCREEEGLARHDPSILQPPCRLRLPLLSISSSRLPPWSRWQKISLIKPPNSLAASHGRGVSRSEQWISPSRALFAFQSPFSQLGSFRWREPTYQR